MARSSRLQQGALAALIERSSTTDIFHLTTGIPRRPMSNESTVSAITTLLRGIQLDPTEVEEIATALELSGAKPEQISVNRVGKLPPLTDGEFTNLKVALDQLKYDPWTPTPMVGKQLAETLARLADVPIEHQDPSPTAPANVTVIE